LPLFLRFTEELREAVYDILLDFCLNLLDTYKYI
jgi:hypothetical protein